MLNDKALSVPVLAAEIERVLVMGDLSKLSPDQRVSYYQSVCESTGLNPLTRPFDYIDLDGKLVLYVKREATDQIRALRGVSVFKLERESVDNLLIVTAHARDAKGREDSAIAAVPLVKEDGEWATAQSGKRYFKGNGNFKPLSPADRANAIMKAETKAKRRVTLSICGLGFLEEEEAEELRGARPAHIDEHGEHNPPKPNSEWEEELPAATIESEDAEFTESPASPQPPPGYVAPAEKVHVPSHEPQGQLGSNGENHKPTRPYSLDLLRRAISARAEKTYAGHRISPGHRGQIVGALDALLGNIDKRHEFLFAVTGHQSSKDIADNYMESLWDWVNGDMDTIKAEAEQAITESLKAQGQAELLRSESNAIK